MHTTTNIKPIKATVPAVFIYVTDVKKSVDWYCELLGLPVPASVRNDLHIFDLSEQHCSNLFLRRREVVQPSLEPIFSLTAPNNEEAFQYLNGLGIEIAHRDEEDILFKDPNGNVLMACSI